MTILLLLGAILWRHHKSNMLNGHRYKKRNISVLYFSETESNFYECMLAESDFIFVLKILQKFKFFNPRWQTYCTFENIIFGRDLAADSPVSVQFYLKMYLGTARHDWHHCSQVDFRPCLGTHADNLIHKCGLRHTHWPADSTAGRKSATSCLTQQCILVRPHDIGKRMWLN